MKKRKKMTLSNNTLEKITEMWSDYLGFPFSTSEVSDMLEIGEVCRWRSIRTDKPESKEVKLFWDLFDTMGEAELNHSNDPALIAINLNEYLSLCRLHGHRTPNRKELLRKLPHSVTHPLVEKSRVIQSRMKESSIRCWIFQR